MYDLGFRIKEIRTRRGLNQKELAQRINKSKSAVCGYETNASSPAVRGTCQYCVCAECVSRLSRWL